jgi:hypothetical protein
MNTPKRMSNLQTPHASRFREANSHSAGQEIEPFMKKDGSLLCSQEPATGLSLFPEMHHNIIILPPTPRSLKISN